MESHSRLPWLDSCTNQLTVLGIYERVPARPLNRSGTSGGIRHALMENNALVEENAVGPIRDRA